MAHLSMPPSFIATDRCCSVMFKVIIYYVCWIFQCLINLSGLVFPDTIPNKRVVLFDPQAHTKYDSASLFACVMYLTTITTETSLLDTGMEAASKFKLFMSCHTCSSFCHHLKLEDLKTFDIDNWPLPHSEADIDIDDSNSSGFDSVSLHCGHPLQISFE